MQLKHVSVSYGGVTALDNVSVQIDEGEVVALMGPNGAGKSTVLKSIFGLAPVDRGSLHFHGKKYTPRSHELVRAGISFVPQGRRVFSRLTVEENLEIGGWFLNNKNERERRKEEIMDMFPALKSKRKALSGTLSGGQQQMLALGRGLMGDPKLLLLDEPSLGLSPKMVKEVFAKIREINERHKTAIMIVEHNLKSLFDIVHRAYLLERGSVVMEGNPKEIVASGMLEKIFLGHRQ